MSYVTPDMKNLTVPQVVLILGLSLIIMSGVVVLAVTGKDVASIFGALATLGLAIAAALGVNIKQTLDQVKDISNGRLTEAIQASRDILEDNKALHNKIAELSLQIPNEDQKL